MAAIFFASAILQMLSAGTEITSPFSDNTGLKLDGWSLNSLSNLPIHLVVMSMPSTATGLPAASRSGSE